MECFLGVASILSFTFSTIHSMGGLLLHAQGRRPSYNVVFRGNRARAAADIMPEKSKSAAAALLAGSLPNLER